jgi:hypothetical protein
MNPMFNNGQEVVVKPVDLRSASTRDSTLEHFTGKVGRVVDSFWISPEAGKTFYLYRVRFPGTNKELVLHEDEIKSLLR